MSMQQECDTREINIEFQGRHTWVRICPRREDNNKIDLQETVCNDVKWIHLTRDIDQWQNVVNTKMCLGVPLKAGNFMANSVTVSFLRMTTPWSQFLLEDHTWYPATGREPENHTYLLL